MSTNKSSNPKKSNVDDVFKGLKYVDSLFNEAAKTDAPKAIKESFENQLKAKLMEGEHKNTPETGKLEENRYDAQNNTYPTYNYNEENPDEPEAATADTTGAADAGLPMDTTGADAGAADAGLPMDTTGDAGADAGLPMDTTGAGEAGADAGLPMDVTGDAGADAGLPVDVTGGSSAGAPPAGGAPEAGADAGAAMSMGGDKEIESPEDIEALVDELIDKDIEQTNEGSMGVEQTSGLEENTNTNSIKENTMANENKTIDEVIAEISKIAEGTESKSANAETLTDKVSGSVKKVDQTQSQGDATAAHIGANYEDLGDKDLEGKVSDSGSAHKESTDFSQVGSTKKVDQTKGQGDATNANLGADYKGLGDKDLETKMKNESTLKSKALFVLAEKYLKLEDELKMVKFENYKSLKANGILALAPNLSEATKISLVKKFDECKSYKETDNLFEDVVKLIKEDKKANISESTGKDKSVKVIKEEKKAEEGKQALSENEKRIMFLSGAKGFEDQYFNGSNI